MVCPIIEYREPSEIDEGLEDSGRLERLQSVDRLAAPSRGINVACRLYSAPKPEAFSRLNLLTPSISASLLPFYILMYKSGVIFQRKRQKSRSKILPQKQLEKFKNFCRAAGHQKSRLQKAAHLLTPDSLFRYRYFRAAGVILNRSELPSRTTSTSYS
jgi:hypothetical protein